LLIEALLCDAAALADGKLMVFGGWSSARLYGRRRELQGNIAGVVQDVPVSREGTRLRLTAEFGRSDHGDASTWEPVRVAGQPVRVSRSVQVQRLPGSPRRGKLAVPFVIELPTVDLDRGSYSWRLRGGGEEVLLPHHNVWPDETDWLGFPAGSLFISDAAAVTGDRLYALGLRTQPELAPSVSRSWALAGRVSHYTRGGIARTELLTAHLEGPSVAEEVEQQMVFPPQPRGPKEFQQLEIPVALALPNVTLAPGPYTCSVDLGDVLTYFEFTVREGAP
jgi:hypothetical protein